MKTASISEAKNRLSTYIDMVRRGETVTITDRGKPVARLTPLEPAAKAFADARLAELVRLGIIIPASEPPLTKLPKPIKPKSGVSVLEALLKNRDEARY